MRPDNVTRPCVVLPMRLLMRAARVQGPMDDATCAPELEWLFRALASRGTVVI